MINSANDGNYTAFKGYLEEAIEKRFSEELNSKIDGVKANLFNEEKAKDPENEGLKSKKGSKGVDGVVKKGKTEEDPAAPPAKKFTSTIGAGKTKTESLELDITNWLYEEDEEDEEDEEGDEEGDEEDEGDDDDDDDDKEDDDDDKDEKAEEKLKEMAYEMIQEAMSYKDSAILMEINGALMESDVDSITEEIDSIIEDIRETLSEAIAKADPGAKKINIKDKLISAGKTLKGKIQPRLNDVGKRIATVAKSGYAAGKNIKSNLGKAKRGEGQFAGKSVSDKLKKLGKNAKQSYMAKKKNLTSDEDDKQ